MKYLLWLFLLPATRLAAQELYVNTEPASNVPSHALAVKLSNKFLRNTHSQRVETRQMPQVYWGVNKQLMLAASATLSDMYTPAYRWESAKLYAKYRFLSSDALYRHFRMAVFAEGTYSRNRIAYQELNLDGDQSGFRSGLIATQLLHKLALSTTLSYTGIADQSRSDEVRKTRYPFQSFNYSLSAGYLVLPKDYTGYGQVNLNLYAELLGQKALDKNLHYLDLAPALQLIFKSQLKVNAGYRFQLNGNQHRMANKSYLLSVEWLFLNAL
jgi:hypothetical protein